MRFRNLTAALLLAWPLAAAAEILLVGKPKVGFDAQGTAGLDIDASASSFAVKEADGKITFTVEMKSIDTGIDLRNHHMCDKFAHCEQYPTVTLVVNRADLPIPTTEEKKVSVPGTFTAHGVAKPTTVDMTVKPHKLGYEIDGSFKFNTNDHGIEIPNYLGVTVEPDMVGRAKFTVADKAAS